MTIHLVMNHSSSIGFGRGCQACLGGSAGSKLKRRLTRFEIGRRLGLKPSVVVRFDRVNVGRPACYRQWAFNVGGTSTCSNAARLNR
ncbi:MAG: hypothetical protein DMG05_08505 [Acidobacteria bacterium]|nr:MAG: hypothetical protein DMG05_08505 [Acidobacteriota bacterium]